MVCTELQAAKLSSLTFGGEGVDAARIGSAQNAAALSAMGQKRTCFYSITSSALASNDCGTVNPSALAVLRFITIWYLVGT